MSYYSEHDKNTYFNNFYPQYMKIDFTSNNYTDKYRYFHAYFMASPKNLKRNDFDWSDFVSKFLTSEFVQSILKNKKPIHTVKRFLVNKFQWEYRKFYNASIRRLGNPYTEKEILAYSSYNLNNKIFEDIRIKEILKVISLLYESPKALTIELNKLEIYGDDLMVYFIKNHTQNKLLDGVSKKINKKYNECLRKIFILNTKDKKGNDYRSFIFLFLKKICAENSKTFQCYKELYKIVNTCAISKAINKRSQYVNPQNPENSYKQFRYNYQEKEWVYKEEREIEYE